MHEGQQARNSCPELPIFFSSLAITWYFLHEYCTTQIWCLGGGATLSPSISRVPSFPPSLLHVSSLIWTGPLSLSVCVSRYGEQLKKARNVGVKKSIFTATAVGSLYFIMFNTFALGFW